MIDSWLFASLCLFFLGICAIIRIIPGPTRLDRIVAANSAITIISAGMLVASVFMGSLVLIEITIIVVVICYAVSGIMANIHGGHDS